MRSFTGCTNCCAETACAFWCAIRANPKTPVRELPVRNLQPMGFGETEDVLPYPRRSFVGYRLLQEYFAFPEKFFFMNLKGLSELQRAGLTSKAEILFHDLAV